MYKCRICETFKPEQEFGKRHTGKLQSYCKKCQREYVREHYNRNKKKYKGYKAKNALRIRNYIKNYKTQFPCVDCGIKYPYYVMDFDHKRDKIKEVSRFVSSGCMKKVIDEISKCDLVCSNCHRIRTYRNILPVV